MDLSPALHWGEYIFCFFGWFGPLLLRILRLGAKETLFYWIHVIFAPDRDREPDSDSGEVRGWEGGAVISMINICMMSGPAGTSCLPTVSYKLVMIPHCVLFPLGHVFLRLSSSVGRLWHAGGSRSLTPSSWSFIRYQVWKTYYNHIHLYHQTS